MLCHSSVGRHRDSFTKHVRSCYRYRFLFTIFLDSYLRTLYDMYKCWQVTCFHRVRMAVMLINYLCIYSIIGPDRIFPGVGNKPLSITLCYDLYIPIYVRAYEYIVKVYAIVVWNLLGICFRYLDNRHSRYLYLYAAAWCIFRLNFLTQMHFVLPREIVVYVVHTIFSIMFS